METVIDVTPNKPSYEELVQSLQMVSKYLQNVGTELFMHSVSKQSRTKMGQDMVRYGKNVRFTVTLAKVGK